LCTTTVVLFSLVGFSTFSQSVLDRTHDLITKNGVTIKSSLEKCENIRNGTSKEYVLLTVFNENPYPVEFSFKKNIWFDGKCNSCSSTSPEHTVSLTIEANGKAQGTCDMNNGLRIFSQMLNLEKVKKLTNYELVDIKVNEVK